MSRFQSGAGDTVYVKPANNIYTVLTAVASIVVLLGMVVLWMKGDVLFGGLLTASPQAQTSVRR